MSNKNPLVLENTQGQVVRIIYWNEPRLVVYYNHTLHRIDFTAHTNELRDVDFAYTILAETSRRELEKGDITLKNKAKLRLVSEIDKVTPALQLNQDNPEDVQKINKWTAGAHAALLLLLFTTHLIMQYFTEKDETPPVIVQMQNLPTAKIKTVSPAERVIKSPRFKAKVAQRTHKPKVVSTRSNKSKAKISRTQVSLSNVGALGALGGMNNGKRGSAGLNLNAANSSLGTSMKSLGADGAGGYQRAVHGGGLVASPMGLGGTKGSGGYSTRGSGGGAPGRGNMNMAGGSSGLMLPLEEEALIEGGLDRDQIAAVIQRNIGQVTYCYEKGLQVKPSLAGRVAVYFVINPGGNVSTARVNNSSLKSASVESCIVQKLKGWRFPQPYGRVNVKVTYPFVLRRLG